MRILRRVSLIGACMCVVAWPTNGQFVFGPPLESPDVVQLSQAAPADADGDGVTDLIGIAGVGANIVVSFGDGHGGFAAPIQITPTITAQVLAIGDLDGDGHVDIVSTRVLVPAVLQQVHVLRGLGGAAFEIQAIFPVGTGVGFVVADLSVNDADGDGDLDVVYVETSAAPTGGEVRLFRNDGTGVLTPEVLSSGDGYESTVVQDLNGDGLADIVKEKHYTTFLDFRVEVLLGVAGGGLAPSATWIDRNLIGVLDLDDDGVLDIVTRNGLASVETRLGLGDGTFEDGPVTASLGFTIKLADLDGDGLPDLVDKILGGFGTLVIRSGDGLGGFADPATAKHLDLFGNGQPTITVTRLAGEDNPSLVLRAPHPFSGGEALTSMANLTYGKDDPQLDLAYAKPGSTGWPGLHVTGRFEGDDEATIRVWNVLALEPAVIVAGATEWYAPFKGGTLVPAPDAVLGPWVTLIDGTLTLTGLWPAGVPTGTETTLQVWISDPFTQGGFSATSAVRITAP